MINEYINYALICKFVLFMYFLQYSFDNYLIEVGIHLYNGIPNCTIVTVGI